MSLAQTDRKRQTQRPNSPLLWSTSLELITRPIPTINPHYACLLDFESSFLLRPTLADYPPRVEHTYNTYLSK